MSYTSENNSPPSFSLERLVQKNAQSLETLEREPYKLIVYAIPEKLLKECMTLLKTATAFQPTLYRQIDALAVRQEQCLETAVRNLTASNDQTMQKMKQTISQDGKNREKLISEVSSMVDSTGQDMRELVSELQAQTKKLIFCTTLLTIVISALVCVTLRFWTG